MIYIHVPFCRRFCTYCGFYSEKAEQSLIKDYERSLLCEISAREAVVLSCLEPATLYIGGGTPSLLAPEFISEVAERLRSLQGYNTFSEFTVEVNPDDITPEYAEALRNAGVNRVSMGVQSFCPESLVWMNRRHDAEGAVKAFGILRNCGFDNISIDLIFGYDPFPGHCAGDGLMEMWQQDLVTAMSLGPEHVSAYQMGIDEGSMLYGMYADRSYCPPDEDLCAAQYAMLQSVLETAGYRQYEVSNFALPGREAIHNSAYWRRMPYVGLGPAAHSFDGFSRYWNVADIRAYIGAGGNPERIRESESLTEEDALVETVMLGLRTAEGIPADLPGINRAAVDRMLAVHALVEDDGRLSIPPEKFFVSDSVIRELI